MKPKTKKQSQRQLGFTLLETMVTMVILLIVSAIAIPGYTTIRRYFRLSGDGREINALVAGAKMQAAADFTHARAYADLGANTFHTEVWNKVANCWQTVGDPGNPCTVAGVSPVQSLSQDINFGFAGFGAPPPNTTAGIQQAPPCKNAAGGTIPNTACVVFNSRGIPIDAAGSPTGNDALYVNDNLTVYGVTVGASGLVQTWSVNLGSSGSTGPTWQHR
jgi:prepilin-type N-terminal cleavage/methylation domain-containing protein